MPDRTPLHFSLTFTKDWMLQPRQVTLYNGCGNCWFRQRDANSFEAIIYSDGKQASKCGIWLGSGSFMKKAFPTAEYISIGDFQFTGSGQTNLVDPEENDPITIDGDLPALYVVLNYIHESLSR